MGDIIANFIGFTVLLYVSIGSLIEVMYYNELFKILGITKSSEDSLIMGYGHTRTMRRLKKTNISSMIVGFISASIFLYQAVSKLIMYIKN